MHFNDSSQLADYLRLKSYKMYINRLFSAFIVGFGTNNRVFYFRRTAFCVDF